MLEEKYVNLTAQMTVYNQLDLNSEVHIPVALRRCSQNDKEEFFSDLSVGLNGSFLQMFCIDDPTAIVLSGNSFKTNS